MKKNNIKKYTQEILKKWSRDKTKTLFAPYRDWGILLTTFFILLIFLIIVNIYFFTYYNKEGVFLKKVDGEEKIKTMKVEELKNTIELFRNKENIYSKFLKEKPSIVDPSL